MKRKGREAGKKRKNERREGGRERGREEGEGKEEKGRKEVTRRQLDRPAEALPMQALGKVERSWSEPGGRGKAVDLTRETQNDRGIGAFSPTCTVDQSDKRFSTLCRTPK